MCRAGFVPSCKPRCDYQPHCFRIHNKGVITSHTVSQIKLITPEQALETLSADDMWHAIMQIPKVNMTHFLVHERQFLSDSSKLTQALSLHNIRRVFPQISYAELTEQQQFHWMKGGENKAGKALHGTGYGSGVQVGNRFDTKI